MALSSMTGFARSHGVAGAYAWAWEIKSVNAKGLDLRLRLPPGWDAIEAPARARAAEKLSRGTVYANLTVERKGVAPGVKINEPVLAAVLATLKSLSGKIDAAPPSLDGILALKGVIEVTDADESESDKRAARSGDHRRLRDGACRSRRHAPPEGATLGNCFRPGLPTSPRSPRAPKRRPAASRRRSRRGLPNRWRRCLRPPRASTATGCTRRRSSSPPRPISARSSTGWSRM